MRTGSAQSGMTSGGFVLNLNGIDQFSFENEKRYVTLKQFHKPLHPYENRT